MENDSRMYVVHCLTPVHIGKGQGVGAVDLPMIREKTTNWPYLPGSSVKGVHREYYRSRLQKSEKWLNGAFGTQSGRGIPTDAETDLQEDHGNAGALVMTDARILAFPVASHYGTFAYVTCPLVLKRLERDMTAGRIAMPKLDWRSIEKLLQAEYVIVSSEEKLVERSSQSPKIYIDEFVSKAKKEPSFADWGDWLVRQLYSSMVSEDVEVSRSTLQERLALVSDEDFQYFVEMCSEIVPRIRINENMKTVVDGALWNEEYLPAESILYGLIWCDPVLNRSANISLNEMPEETFLQIGGNATVGKGRIRCCYVKGGAE